ncbi:helix-turn-helix domain-containing protein [Jiulongibacter sp. NS-SX5]|uniref:helix-turn-helix domain-containing protein n=1 Tax=Jiulongibacter sp. NS-SX5 TaxID=3463854 RepID=UPI0040593F73
MKEYVVKKCEPSGFAQELLQLFELELKKKQEISIPVKFGTGKVFFSEVERTISHFTVSFNFRETSKFVFSEMKECQKYKVLFFLRYEKKSQMPLSMAGQLKISERVICVTGSLDDIPDFVIKEGRKCRLDIIFLQSNWLKEVLPPELKEVFDKVLVHKNSISWLRASTKAINVDDILSVLKSFHTSSPFKRLSLLGELYQLIGEYINILHDLDRRKGKVKNINNHDMNTINKIEQYLKDHVRKVSPSLDDIAKEFGISRTKVCNLFKYAYGTGINSYYNVLKLEEAKKMLTSNAYSINEVSDKLAFTNQSYFSRWFKKHTGINPSSLV